MKRFVPSTKSENLPSTKEYISTSKPVGSLVSNDLSFMKEPESRINLNISDNGRTFPFNFEAENTKVQALQCWMRKW